MPPSIPHPKRRGEWVELLFMARAAALGLTICRPWGDSARYDFAVESGGHFLRVQVKSTTHRRQGAWLCHTVSRHLSTRGVVCSGYSGEIDLFAFYIVPRDLWYLIPISALGPRQYAVYLNPDSPRSRYNRYQEAWERLRKVLPSRTRSTPLSSRTK